MSNSYINFPKQKISRRNKTSKWGEECIDAALHYTSLYDYTRRSPRYKKIRNYNLYNGKFDKEDLEYVCNPYGIADEGFEFPANMQYYPIATPIFDLLLGEEAKRSFSYVVRAVNPEAITRKEKQRKEEIIESLKTKLLQLISPEEAQAMQQEQQEPEEILKYYKYSYQDMRENVATQALNYLYKQQDLNYKFQRGWKDALIGGEEIYKVGVIANEPIAKRCNPVEIYALLPHNQDTLDEAEVIVEETYLSISEIVDNFYEELTPGQIDDLEDKESSFASTNESNFILPDRAVIGTSSSPSPLLDDSSIYDSDGNIRVCFVTWKSKKKVGELTYTDELGVERSTIVDETYKKSTGEKVKWFWINEYWEGTKIGSDIYIDIKPKDLQFRRMDNISACKSGYIGTVYNATNSQSVSLMDRLVPWIYLYIVMWYRTELLIAANQGKIALIDLSLIPDGWEIEKWLYYASAMKFGFVDSFNEGKKGQSTGKLAGNISTQNKALDLETGAAIQGHISLLEFIETKLQELSGVTRQRMGAISASETVGGVKHATVQSSHITEKWFQIHNWTKKRVLESLVEAAKEAWKEGSKKLQYVTSDLAAEFFSVDGNDFNNAEYGVFVSDAAKDVEALQMLKELTQAAMQNDKALLSGVADVYSSESLADVKSKLRDMEEMMQQRQDQAQKQQLESNERVSQMELEKQQRELDKDYYKIDKDNETKIAVAEINSFKMQKDQDINDNGIPDQLEIEKLKEQKELNKEKIKLERDKLKQQKELKEKELKQKARDSKNKDKKSKK